MTLAYATVQQVRAAATDGSLNGNSSEAIEAAALEASRVVDDFCGRFFGRQVRTLTLLVKESLRIPLPVAVADDDSTNIGAVIYVRSEVELPREAWVYVPATDIGTEPYIEVGGRQGHDFLRVGMEAYNGGCRGFYGRDREAQPVRVTATFGEETFPLAVQQATAAVAALYLGYQGERAGSPFPAGSGAIKSYASEGVSVTFDRPEQRTSAGRIATTGSAYADRLLAAHQRSGLGWNFY